MSEMVERVARALAARFKVNDAEFDLVRENYAELAEIAIAAMREPTKDMIAAFSLHDGRPNRLSVVYAYTLMIDAALT